MRPAEGAERGERRGGEDDGEHAEGRRHARAVEDDARDSGPAERGQTLKQFVTEALQEKVAVNMDKTRSREPGWMERFGKLRRLRKETQRIRARIDERFEVIEPEDRVSPVSSAVV